MMRRISLILLFFVAVSVCRAQAEPSGDVYVKSWITGNQIREQSLTFDLSSSKHEQTAVVRDYGAGSYKLSLTPFPAGKRDYEREYWQVQLRLILSKEGRKEKLGPHLLTEEGPPGPGGDYFPRGDWVAVLVPREAPAGVLEKAVYSEPYPISARRVIKVQNFFVLIKVNSYKMNEHDPKKIDAMNVTVEFRDKFTNDECK